MRKSQVNELSEEEEFDLLRRKYQDARNAQRLKIVEALKEAKLDEVEGRQGVYNYKGGGTFEPEFNLGSWKYITARCGDAQVYISLQTFDRDANTNNVHILVDRIGLRVTTDGTDPAKFPTRGVSIDEWVQAWADARTEFMLPLSDNNLKKLVEVIKRKISELES